MQQPCQAIMGYIAVAEKKCGPQNETTFSPHNLCNTRPPKRDHFLTQKDARIWLQKRNHFLTPRTRPHCGPKNETTARKTRPLSDSKREPRKGLRKHGQKRSRKQDRKTVMRTAPFCGLLFGVVFWPPFWGQSRFCGRISETFWGSERGLLFGPTFVPRGRRSRMVPAPGSRMSLQASCVPSRPRSRVQGAGSRGWGVGGTGQGASSTQHGAGGKRQAAGGRRQAGRGRRHRARGRGHAPKVEGVVGRGQGPGAREQGAEGTGQRPRSREQRAGGFLIWTATPAS